MQELLQAALAPANIVYTTLLLVIIFYWISVVIGALDATSLDFDLDMDVDVDMDMDMDMDVDADADMDMDADGSGFSIAGSLSFFNFGKIPFMFLMTFLIGSMWVISILANKHLPGGGTIIFALILFLPNLAISLVVTKVLSTPLLPLFKDYRNKGVEDVDYIGQVGKLKMSAAIGQIGQAEVIYDGNPLLITIKADPISGALKKGQEVLIIGKTDNQKYFKVKAIEN